MYRNTRSDSPKGQVFTAYEIGGERAAEQKGDELGLPESKVRRWLDDWMSSAPPRRVKADDERGPTVKERRDSAAPFAKGDKVYRLCSDGEIGIVQAAGPQQSEVKWLALGNIVQAEVNTSLRLSPQTTNGKADMESEADKARREARDKIIEKVRKVLALASSSNENEAAVAAERAHTLLLKQPDDG